MASDASLIIQVPRDSAIHMQLTRDPPPTAAGETVVIETGPTDAEGSLEAYDVGEVVLSVPSPEALHRQADDVHRVIVEAGGGVEPLIVVVEVAEELREEELAPVLEAAAHTSRAVIVRIIRGD
jgi:hypothetical protein